MTKSYRPSNGTEGEMFMAQWCYRCIKENGCTILTGAMVGKQPKQWVRNPDPQCTSFQDHRRPTNYRCKQTADLFSDGPAGKPSEQQ